MATDPSTSTTTNPKPPNQHDADEAGGEAIFSSDGLDPLPIPPPPAFFSSSRKTTNNDDNDDNEAVLDSETTCDPIRAFEIFQGKVFRPEGGGGGPVVGSSSESTAARLARIERDLSELEAEQTALAAASSSSSGGSGGGEGVQDVIEELSRRLTTLRGGTIGSGHQNSLTTLMKKEIHRLSDGVGAAGDAGGTTDGARVIYELYGSAVDGSSSAALPPMTETTEEQEERLNRIEALLGTNTTSATTSELESASTSLLDRLRQVEDTLKGVDDKVLESACARAKVIRADLEAAAKARHKLSSSSHSTTSTDDHRTISQLHSTLLDIDPFLSTDTLPLIVQRLQACAGLHSRTAEFESSLRVLEGTLGDVEGSVVGLEESMGFLERGMVENMEVVMRNMEELDRVVGSGGGGGGGGEE